LSEHSRLGLRLMGLSSSRTFTRSGNNYDISFFGLPLLFGVDTEYYESIRWSFNVGLYVGFNFLHNMSVTASNANPPNSFTVYNAERAWTALLTLTTKYHWSASTVVFFELSGFYTNSKLLRIASGGFNGSSAFSQ